MNISPLEQLSKDGIAESLEGEALEKVVNAVKERADAQGGYVTYDELNQILPANIPDAIHSDRYLKILEAFGVHIIREEDVQKYLEDKKARESALK